MEIPILGGAYTGRSVKANSEELLNMFLEKGGKGGRDALYGTPGLTADLAGTNSEIRGMLSVDPALIAYVKGNQFRILVFPSTDTLIGTLNSSTGQVFITRNNTQFLIADGTDLYAYTWAGAFAEITDLNSFTTTVEGVYSPAFLTGEQLTLDYANGKISTQWFALVGNEDNDTGGFGIEIDGRYYEVLDLDYSGIDPTEPLSAVAAYTQTALRAVTGNEETVSHVGNAFVFRSSSSKSTSSVSNLLTPSSGLDLSGNAETLIIPRGIPLPGGGTATVDTEAPTTFFRCASGQGVVANAALLSGTPIDATDINVANSNPFIVGDDINVVVDGNPGDTTVTYVKREITAIAGLPAYIEGRVANTEDDYTVWALITNGSFRVRMNGYLRDITGLDFTGVTSMAEVAAIIQTAIRLAQGADDLCTWETDHFKIKTIYAQITSDVSYLSYAGEGTDISGDGYLAMTSAFGILTNRNTEREITIASALGDTAAVGNEIYITSTFPDVASCTYLDGFGIVNKKVGESVYISSLNNFFFWETLDFAEASSNADDVLRVLADNKELWVFSSSSVGVYYNAGTSDYPFKRIIGAYLPHGCGAKATPAIIDSSFIWFTDKGQVRMSQGHQSVAVSTPQIEDHFTGYETVSDAFGYTMLWKGHWWYVLTFPSISEPSWVFDATTGEWFRWGTGTGRHRSNCHAYTIGEHYVGDYANGDLNTLSDSVFTDLGSDITRTIVGPNILNGRKRFKLSSFELDIESGVGTGGWALSYSADGGHTYSSSSTLTLGASEAYSTRLVKRRLGQHRSFAPKLTTTAARELVVLGAYVNIEGEDEEQR